MRTANGARKNADHPGHTSDNSSMISNLLATLDSFCSDATRHENLEWQEDSGQLPLLSAKRCILGVPSLRCQTLRSKKDRVCAVKLYALKRIDEPDHQPHLPLFAPRVLVKCSSTRKMDDRGGGDRTHDLRLKRPLLYH